MLEHHRCFDNPLRDKPLLRVVQRARLVEHHRANGGDDRIFNALHPSGVAVFADTADLDVSLMQVGVRDAVYGAVDATFEAEPGQRPSRPPVLAAVGLVLAEDAAFDGTKVRFSHRNRLPSGGADHRSMRSIDFRAAAEQKARDRADEA